MKKHLNCLSLLGLLLTLTSFPLAAAPRAVISESADGFIIPLHVLQGSSMPLDLRGAEARKSLSLSVSPRMSITSAELELVYTNSISMQPRSQLAITLDERILAQLPLKAEQPDNAARISLAAQHLNPGYHELGFRAAQHYTDQCEDGSAPELFSQIDVQQSQVRIQATRNPIQPSLARLDDLFDSRLWLNQYPLSVITAETGLLDASALAVQGAALRLNFMPVQVSVSPASVRHNDSSSSSINPSTANFPGLVPPSDNTSDIILIGSKQALTPLLAPAVLDDIQGAYLGLYPLDSDPSRGVLVISGLDLQQVTQAARVLALKGLALPDRPSIQISELNLPQGFSRLLGRTNTSTPADENGWISFDRLGFNTTTLHGMYPRPAELNFWAFAEMFDPRQRELIAELTFAYGAGFDKKSALNIFLNGQFIQALHLNDPHGAQQWRARINIPIAQLQAGRNTLSFAPSVIGQDVGGECRPIFTDNLYVSLASDSRIALPPSGGFMRLPDLSLLSRTGLPYTQAADGLGSGLLLLGDDAPTHSAALTLLGKLAQVNKAALTGLRISRDLGELNGISNLLLVGDPGRLMEPMQREVSAFLPRFRWQTLVVGNREQRLPLSLQNWLSDLSLSPLNERTSTPVSASVQLDSSLGRSTAAVQYPSEHTGGTITLFSAANSQQLQASMNQLIGFETWGALNGNGMLWSPSGEPLAFSFPVTHRYVGDIAPTTKLSLLLTDRLWLLVSLALGVILLTSFITWFLLRRRAKRLKLE